LLSFLYHSFILIPLIPAIIASSVNNNFFALCNHLDEAEFVLVIDDFEHARTFVFFLEAVYFGDSRDLVIVLFNLLNILLTSVESLINTLKITPEFLSLNQLIDLLVNDVLLDELLEYIVELVVHEVVVETELK